LFEFSTPLPPSRSGLSPTKQSPPLPQSPFSQDVRSGPTVITNGSSTAAILPPVPTLLPSPRQQILTPPVKSTEVPRQQSSIGQIQGQTQLT
jgi:hypothetical protein